MMRAAIGLALFGTSWLCAAVPLHAAPATIGEWLYSSTGLSQGNFSGTRIAKPDYLAGKTKDEMCGVISRFGRPSANAGTWLVLGYDAVHHLGLAASSTDACNVALFSAAPPPQHVRRIDLSGYGSARGIRIGSSYAQVLSTYGGNAAADRISSRRFRHRYRASVPTTTTDS